MAHCVSGLVFIMYLYWTCTSISLILLSLELELNVLFNGNKGHSEIIVNVVGKYVVNSVAKTNTQTHTGIADLSLIGMHVPSPGGQEGVPHFGRPTVSSFGQML